MANGKAICFCAGVILSVLIGMLSLTIAILNFREKRHIAIGIICLLLSAVTIPMLMNYTAINNPFTSQQFAAVVHNDMTWPKHWGTITYYRKFGSVLYDPHETEDQEFSLDINSVVIGRNSIYTNIESNRVHVAIPLILVYDMTNRGEAVSDEIQQSKTYACSVHHWHRLPSLFHWYRRMLKNRIALPHIHKCQKSLVLN